MRSVICAALVCAGSASGCPPFKPFNNVDFNNGDLPAQPVSKALSTPAECAALCCATSGCGAFSLNAGGPGTRWCYLKGLSGYSIGSSPGCDSGCFSGDCAVVPPSPDAYFPWYDLSIPRAERLALLVKNMTQAEAIQWLNDGVPAIPRLGLPAYSWEAEGLHGVSWNGVATVFPQNIAWGATWDVPLVSRIADTIALEARAKWVAGLGADGSSSEFAGLSFMTPNNNLFLDPFWDGEDPVLTSAITYALVRGLQFGDDPAYTRMIATTKHFLGYHLESWAGDGQYRLSHSFNYSQTDIQQIYMAPFRAAIRANVTACMCAYDGANGTNPAWPHPGGPEPWGVPMCAHPDLQRLMRDPALGWEGYVISDEGSITFMSAGYHSYTHTLVDAACLAMNAGTDLALGGEYASTLSHCLAQGNVSDARLREALTRVLSAQFNLGWFDTIASIRSQGTAKPFADPVSYNANVGDANVSTPAARALSHTAAVESMVLLSNQHAVLPLAAASLRKLTLIGPAASWGKTATGSYIGNYAGCEDGPGGSITTDSRCHVVTLLEALTTRSTSDGWTLSYAAGSDINTAGDDSGFSAAVAAAIGADVIIAAVGLDTCQESRCSEGEANDRGTSGGQFPRAGLELGGSQLPLLQAVHAAHPLIPLVVIYFNGGPISSPWTMANANAVLEAWYPGNEGGAAVVEVLFGEASPAGRMPITTVSGVAELPPRTDFILSTPPGRTHLYYSGTPLTPFGFGLSYATFTYAGLVVPHLGLTDATVTISATVTHAGGMVSDEVAQLYGHFEAPSVGVASIPRQQLLAFERLHALGTGNSRPVAFTLERDAFALVDAAGVRRVQPGTWTVWLGGGPPSNAAYGGGAVLVGTLVVE